MDIEIRPRPFTKGQLEQIKRNLRAGRIRRFGAIANHRKLEFRHNALVAWKKESISSKMRRALQDKEYASHIYLRKPHPLWPYGLYTMVHARNKEELDLFIKELSQLMPGCAYKVLNTIKELKKTSFKPNKCTVS
jgi:DNA-binding Lrp family transcriptional regulator